MATIEPIMPADMEYARALGDIHDAILQSFGIPAHLFYSRPHTMTQEESLLQKIAENLDDDTPRLIFADWLEECNQTNRAEFIRIQIELAKISCDRKGHHYPCRPYGPGGANGPFHTCEKLRRREWELLQRSECWPELVPLLGTGVLKGAHEPLAWRRGFIESVTLPCQSWLDHGPAIVEAAPTIREVKLSDVSPYPVDGENKRHFWQENQRRQSSNTFRRRRDLSNYLLPTEIYRLIESNDVPPTRGHPHWKRFPSKDAALRALSDACLQYAHSCRHTVVAANR